MSDAVVDALILDLLEWIAMRERTYEEVMNAWRTSCPRLPVWEEASERGLVRSHVREGVEMIEVTPRGRQVMEECRRHA